jgi:hypothetical protein
LSTVTDRAGAWFLRSGIQEPNGGVARYYHSDLARNAGISNEITGYTVSTLAFLHRRTGLPDYRQAALRAADFLTNLAWDPESAIFPFQYPPDGLAYFFDSGIIVRGLLSAWRLSNQEVYLAAAVKGGRAMLRDFKGPPIAPILSLPDKKALAFEPRWSAMPGCYQLKAALAWHDLALITGETEFRQGYEQCLAAALKDSEDFLPGAVQQDRVMDRLHPVCYFLEGLLPVVDRQECADAYQRGLKATAQYLHQIEPEFVRSDVYAQLLRARLYAHSLGFLPMDEAAGVQEAAETGKFQLTSEDSRIDGGFGFGWKQGRDLPYVNPVSTAFCLQSLELWADYQSAAPAPRLQDLI